MVMIACCRHRASIQQQTGAPHCYAISMKYHTETMHRTVLNWSTALLLGVHLDEPLTPKSWERHDTGQDHHKLDEFFCESVLTPTHRIHMSSQSANYDSALLGQELAEKCVTSQEQIRAKSESPRLDNEMRHLQITTANCADRPHQTFGKLEKNTSKSCCQFSRDQDESVLFPSSDSGATSPKSTDTAAVHFTIDSDVESDTENVNNEASTKPPLTKSQIKEERKSRFKKMLRPLRRSHSAGSGKDVPAHALFLRHEHKLQKSHDSEKKEARKTRKQEDERKSAEATSSSESENAYDTMDKEKKGNLKKKKSIAQDMKEKLAFLKRRHTDTALSNKDKKVSSNILEWGKSFENLLSDKYGLELFRDFLRTEFSEENIEFWIACEEYKSVKSSKLSERAQQIYSDFVAVQAPKEINLDSKTRLATIACQGNPNRHTFENAQRRIQALMGKDSYPRFLRSETYQELLANYNKSNT